MPGGFALSRAGLPLLDEWSEFQTTAIDKLDVTANIGDVLVQFRVHSTNWEPVDGVIVRRGLFRSIPALATMYPPGPTGIRFKRARRGAAASVDFDAYATA